MYTDLVVLRNQDLIRFTVEWYQGETLQGTQSGLSQNHYDLQNLTPGVEYNWRVGTSDGWSQWSQFSTEETDDKWLINSVSPTDHISILLNGQPVTMYEYTDV